MSEVGKFGEVFTVRELVSPEISKKLAEWLLSMVDGCGTTVTGIVNLQDQEVFIYKWEAQAIEDAYMNEDEPFPELVEFVNYLIENRVNYVDFPEGL